MKVSLQHVNFTLGVKGSRVIGIALSAFFILSTLWPAQAPAQLDPSEPSMFWYVIDPNNYLDASRTSVDIDGIVINVTCTTDDNCVAFFWRLSTGFHNSTTSLRTYLFEVVLIIRDVS